MSIELTHGDGLSEWSTRVAKRLSLKVKGVETEEERLRIQKAFEYVLIDEGQQLIREAQRQQRPARPD